ncbi:GHKL domain-containing protein [Anaerolentibacter hominis]|uniref:GHKL domain-containing protein n=1 Tax=Anaerolentibacter hominis TaxID=3079009 RepID=UPI0031B8A545
MKPVDIVNTVGDILFFYIFVYFLIKRRYSVKQTLITLMISFAVILTGNLILIHVLGRDLTVQLSGLTVTVPVIIICYVLSKYRGFQCVFCVLTAASFLMFSGLIRMIVEFFQIGMWFDNFISSLTYLLALFMIIRLLRRPLWTVMEHLKVGWASLSLIPIIFCFSIDFLLTAYQPVYQHPIVLWSLIPLLLFLVISYYLIYQLFKNMQQEFINQDALNALSLQTQLLKKHLMLMQQEEEKNKINRHDLRHYMQIIRSLVLDQKWEQALSTIDKYSSDLANTKICSYSTSLSINAAISSFLHRAADNGVHLNVSIIPPEGFPVDEQELAVVFSNAVENAVNACLAVPPDKERKIIVTAKQVADQYIIEVMNTYEGLLTFSEETGLPISRKKGHGTGTRSIAAFAAKYGAILDCSAQEGWFELRILLQK